MDAIETNQALQAAAAQINKKMGNGTMVQNTHVTEDYSVPDRLVGLIIGKGGEHITQIQAETNCKVQFAPDAGGKPDRPCTITGPRHAIEHAKMMIANYIEKGSGAPEPLESGQVMQEVAIPGHKVGLIIGKGGETIKQLQEMHRVKMVMIQESNYPTADDKPLRITGDPQRCAMAIDAVRKLMAEKDAYSTNTMTRPLEVAVPRSMVGIVIGKNGEMIRKIQAESGAKVQFVPDDSGSADRICTISGHPEKTQQAASMISDLISNANQLPTLSENHMYGSSNQNEYSFCVPRDKCGLVIGKGGQTVHELCRMSNAHIELKRNHPQSSDQREFSLKGSPDQCYHAVQLICEKAGIQPPSRENLLTSNSFGILSNNSFANQQASHQTYRNTGFGQTNNSWSSPNYSVSSTASSGWQQAPQAAADLSKDGTWANYYQCYGNQQQQATSPQATVNQQSSIAPQINPQTGQPDYSAAWAEYYRQQGMHYQADMILAQARAQQGGTSQSHPST